MELFTKIDIPESEFKIDYNSNLFFIGSCFADNISRRFAERKFHILANPLGTVYNPLSIERQLGKIAGCANPEDCSTELWTRWDYQGDFSDEALMQTVETSRDFIAKADVIFITLGTAYVYFLKETGKAVANCHKQPAELFERRLISIDEAADALKHTVLNILKVKQDCQILRSVQDNTGRDAQDNTERDARDRDINSKDVRIVFTVSPLRHLNDGAHGNNLSKATLHLAIEKVMQEFAEANRSEKCCAAETNYDAINNAEVSYFPSYEIVMDELRDYRFYAEDMSHLTPTAEDYIFERMCETYCNDTTIAHIKYVEKFMKTASHRIVDAGSIRTAEMAKQQIERAQNLEHIIPGLDLSAEKEYFRKLASV